MVAHAPDGVAPRFRIQIIALFREVVVKARMNGTSLQAPSTSSQAVCTVCFRSFLHILITFVDAL